MHSLYRCYPSTIRLQNILPVEIIAKRFPIDETVDMTKIPTEVHTQLNLCNIGIDIETAQAEIHLEVNVTPTRDPSPFTIYFKLVGIFAYPKDYSPEVVQRFLQEGSLSLLLPSARELLLSLCTHLQIPILEN